MRGVLVEVALERAGQTTRLQVRAQRAHLAVGAHRGREERLVRVLVVVRREQTRASFAPPLRLSTTTARASQTLGRPQGHGLFQGTTQSARARAQRCRRCVREHSGGRTRRHFSSRTRSCHHHHAGSSSRYNTTSNKNDLLRRPRLCSDKRQISRRVASDRCPYAWSSRLSCSSRE